FGLIRINGVTYEHDVVIDRGENSSLLCAAAAYSHICRGPLGHGVLDKASMRIIYQWPLKEETGSEGPLLQARGRTCVLHPTQIVMVWEAGHRSPGFTLFLVRSSWRGYFQSKPAG